MRTNRDSLRDAQVVRKPALLLYLPPPIWDAPASIRRSSSTVYGTNSAPPPLSPFFPLDYRAKPAYSINTRYPRGGEQHEQTARPGDRNTRPAAIENSGARATQRLVHQPPPETG